MSIYFLRHIKTDNNLNKIITGRAEANVLPCQKIEFPNNSIIYFDSILCSESRRCRETIKLIPEITSSNIEYYDELLERDVGILEGIRRDDAILRYPKLFKDKKLCVKADIPNGESIDDVIARLERFIPFLKENQCEKNILICSHNQTLKIFFKMLKNAPITDEYWQTYNFENGKIICITDVIAD